MKINWKDFALMYAIGVIAIVVAAATTIIVKYTPLLGLVLLICCSAPAIFFFSRNPCKTKEAILISLLFGYMIVPAYIFTLFFGLSIFSSTKPDISGILNRFTFIELILGTIILGICFATVIFLAHITYKYQVGKPTPPSSPLSKPLTPEK